MLKTIYLYLTAKKRSLQLSRHMLWSIQNSWVWWWEVESNVLWRATDLPWQIYHNSILSRTSTAPALESDSPCYGPQDVDFFAQTFLQCSPRPWWPFSAHVKWTLVCWWWFLYLWPIMSQCCLLSIWHNIVICIHPGSARNMVYGHWSLILLLYFSFKMPRNIIADLRKKLVFLNLNKHFPARQGYFWIFQIQIQHMFLR